MNVNVGEFPGPLCVTINVAVDCNQGYGFGRAQYVVPDLLTVANAGTVGTIAKLRAANVDTKATTPLLDFFISYSPLNRQITEM